ncbi:MAG TPA: hypothetical protein VGP16_33000 [Asanoa sp.]|jgi:multidrug efflux pump subunit AcrA (membrane-fusion protein)|nr:hypothetical protein [Asanoa sp.]
MTGQDGGFRAAAARFKAEVEAALTRARRAADEAKAQSADFRRGSEDLAKQVRTGRLRRVHRGQVAATSTEARAEAEKFRNLNDLTVEDLPDADKIMARLPDAPGEEPAIRREDDDFSQHKVLFDLDAPDAPETGGSAPDQPGRPPVDQTSDRPAAAGIDSPDGPRPRRSDEDEDFSQQRILFDATVESYRPDPLPDSVFELPDEQNRS